MSWIAGRWRVPLRLDAALDPKSKRVRQWSGTGEKTILDPRHGSSYQCICIRHSSSAESFSSVSPSSVAPVSDCVSEEEVLRKTQTLEPESHGSYVLAQTRIWTKVAAWQSSNRRSLTTFDLDFQRATSTTSSNNQKLESKFSVDPLQVG